MIIVGSSEEYERATGKVTLRAIVIHYLGSSRGYGPSDCDRMFWLWDDCT